MINFDMVGRLNKNKELAINGVGTSSKWNKLLDESNNFHFKLIKSNPHNPLKLCKYFLSMAHFMFTIKLQ